MISMENGGDETMRSHRSSTSNISSGTFRDTHVNEDAANTLLHSQSLMSIVNNPKKDSIVRKMASMVKSKVIGSSVPKFKALKES